MRLRQAVSGEVGLYSFPPAICVEHATEQAGSVDITVHVESQLVPRLLLCGPGSLGAGSRDGGQAERFPSEEAGPSYRDVTQGRTHLATMTADAHGGP